MDKSEGVFVWRVCVAIFFLVIIIIIVGGFSFFLCIDY